MSIRDAANWLGLDGDHQVRWLRRYLITREADTGQAILVRVGKNPQRPRYRVSAASLRKYAPELVDPSNDIARSLRGLVESIKRDREDTREVLEDIQFQLTAILEMLRRQRN